MRARALSHSRACASSRATVGKRSLVMLNVAMDVGGAVGAVRSWAAALKHLPVALAQANSQVLRKEGGVCEISVFGRAHGVPPRVFGQEHPSALARPR